MFEIYHFSQIDIFGFAMMLIRVSACMVAFPIFGSAQIPPPIKILISLALTMVLFPVSRPLIDWVAFQQNELSLIAIREVVVGLFIGFLGRLFFIGISVAGQILGFSTGLSSASLFNPGSNEPGVVIEQFQYILGVLLFFAFDGHHVFLKALHASFTLITLGQLGINVQSMANVVLLGQKTLEIGVQLAAPVIAVIWFMNIAMGILGRAVTQINVFVVSFPINFMAGMVVFLVSLPLMVEALDLHFSEMGQLIFKYLRDF